MTEAAYPYAPERVQIHMFGTRSLCDRTVRAAIADTLLPRPEFAPQLMGFEARRGEPFDREALCDVDWVPSANFRYQLSRERKQAYRLRMSLGRTPFFQMSFPLSRTPAARLPLIFELADALAEAYRPLIGWAHIFGRTEGHRHDPVKRAQRLMDLAADGHTPSYGSEGAGGLGLRTYLGRSYTDHLAPLLATLPAPATVTPLSPPGAVRVDLTEKPWTSGADKLHSSWRTATDHLAPSGCFCLPSFTPSGGLARQKAHPH